MANSTGAMTVEAQRLHIANERSIIAGLKKNKLRKSDELYIADLEHKIQEREAWVERKIEQEEMDANPWEVRNGE